MPRRLDAPDFRLFLGKSGSGKSTLARYQARGARRLLIHDPNAEASWAEGASVVYGRAELVEAMRGRAWCICWRGAVAARGEAEARDAFEWANRAALAAGDALIIWDEVDRFTDAGRLPPHAYTMVNAGRHRGLRVFACSRRVRRVSRDLTANAGRIVVFQMTEPGDLAWIRNAMGADAAAMAPRLDFARREALDWSEREVKKKISPFR